MPVSTLQMRVAKYIPERLFGFAKDEDREVFFHLGAFSPGEHPFDPRSCAKCLGCPWSTTPPPPIIGEEVRVEIDLDIPLKETGSPRAVRVVRLNPPQSILGIVERFDTFRGYGFVKGEDDLVYHLHRSEIVDGRIPVAEQEVRFFSGTRQNRPRACYVKICLEG